jgi:uncharacterized protein
MNFNEVRQPPNLKIKSVYKSPGTSNDCVAQFSQPTSKPMKQILFILALICSLHVSADEVIPSLPAHYFNDYANVVSSETASRLDKTLENCERESSDQIVVAVFQKMQSDAPVKDYTLRIMNAWKVGQKGKNNGVVLFVFIQDHKMYLNVGTGLEKTLPDATCQHILATEISPQFKKGDFDAGLSAGVTAILAATKGAYQGNGHTVAEPASTNSNVPVQKTTTSSFP